MDSKAWRMDEGRWTTFELETMAVSVSSLQEESPDEDCFYKTTRATFLSVCPSVRPSFLMCGIGCLLLFGRIIFVCDS